MSRHNHPKRVPQRAKRRDMTFTLAVRSPTVSRCMTGKAGFPLQVAEAKLKVYQGSNRNVKPVRVYLCQVCDSYHLTSQAETS